MLMSNDSGGLPLYVGTSYKSTIGDLVNNLFILQIKVGTLTTLKPVSLMCDDKAGNCTILV